MLPPEAANEEEIAVPRIEEFEIYKTEGRVRRDLEAQAKRWGAPLTPSLICARNPALFVAVRGMWKALGSSGHIDPALAVEPQHVVPRKQESEEGSLAADAGMGAMPIIVVEPGIEVSGALLG